MTLYAVLAAIVGGLMSLAAMLFAARKSGADSVTAKKVKQDEKVRKEFDQIDGDVPDVDAALKRLRDRSRRAGS